MGTLRILGRWRFESKGLRSAPQLTLMIVAMPLFIGTNVFIFTLRYEVAEKP